MPNMLQFHAAKARHFHFSFPPLFLDAILRPDMPFEARVFFCRRVALLLRGGGAAPLSARVMRCRLIFQLRRLRRLLSPSSRFPSPFADAEC